MDYFQLRWQPCFVGAAGELCYLHAAFSTRYFLSQEFYVPSNLNETQYTLGPQASIVVAATGVRGRRGEGVLQM